MSHRRPIRRLAIRLAAAAALAPLGVAQSFQFTLEPALSSTNISASFELDLPSTAIGDWDATSNPTGTRTCTNIFGACNNTSIPFDNSAEIASVFAGAPSGSFTASIDVAGGVAVVSGLTSAPLGRTPGGADLTLNLLYPTFRTAQPDSLFIGGIPLPLPLGQIAIDNLTIVQSADALGALVPSGVSDVYDFVALVPANLEFDLDLLGTPAHVGPLPFALPMSGVLDLRAGAATFQITVDASGADSLKDPFGGQTFEDLPFPLPTILPPGGVANLLFDITPGDLVYSFLSDLDWTANGVGVCEPASYCVTTPNTWSNGALMQTAGSTSIALNGFVLQATEVPPGHPGRFAMSRQQAQLPFGDGTLCLGGVVRRYPVVWADASGVASYAVDFNDPSQPGRLLSAGETWNFQFLFRDPIGGPLTFNTSDAVSLTMCP